MIHTLDLFEPLDDLLLDLLRSLTPEDWTRPTIAGAWTVRDVAAHLLDTPLRRLSLARDGYRPTGQVIASDADLVALVDTMNADGVRVYGRLSSPILIELMELATRHLRAHLAAIAPEAPAAFPVSWAGEAASAHWFDVAREYTERWHHQAQIRLAVGRLEPLMVSSLYTPVVSTFMRAVPHALGTVTAPPGTTMQVDVEGVGGGSWRVHRVATGWHMDAAPVAGPAVCVVIPAAAAWRLFTKGLTPDEVTRQCRVTGDAVLGAAVLATRAIVG